MTTTDEVRAGIKINTAGKGNKEEKKTEKEKEDPRFVKKYHMYRSTISSCRMVTDHPMLVDKGRNPYVMTFIDGRYYTDNPEIIDYLDREIKANNPYLSKEVEMYSDADLDPEEVRKEKYLEEFFANEEAIKKAVASGKLNVSKYTQEPIKPAGTDSVAMLAEGSNSQ